VVRWKEKHREETTIYIIDENIYGTVNGQRVIFYFMIHYLTDLGILRTYLSKLITRLLMYRSI